MPYEPSRSRTLANTVIQCQEEKTIEVTQVENHRGQCIRLTERFPTPRGPRQNVIVLPVDKLRSFIEALSAMPGETQFQPQIQS